MPTRTTKPSSAIALCLASALAASATQAAADAAPESDRPIRIAINEWTGQHVTATILGKVYQSMGYEVEYVTAGAIPQFTALVEGEITVQPEIWSNLVGDAWPNALASGAMVNLGSLGLNNFEGWAYPKYMEETCPGLPDLAALVACKDQIATAETFPKGRILAYPADWGTRTIDAIAALGLPVQGIAAGSEGAMVAEIRSAFAQQRPLVLMFWSPHWVHAEFDLGWIEITPPFAAECLTDPAWGPNPDATGDCAFEQAAVDKGAWSGMSETWPAAFGVLERFALDGTDQSAMVFEIDRRGRPLEEVVDEWLAANPETWKAWLPEAG
ncbi:ABC transporter substrate-binding protein [Paralimibaculum aggregatum]|uniref:ABC transporter substrate-binding protein n=1 Tax=Paralimibaculum aggregatum TaxID=3036245 RepID=A0ABQ6LKH6_9RHOB|nr:ABC transporter substrate-binding protein [Limibaculum sp. NKW23]GMG82734.1 ABC transporter substrate-binding protein [Limibaculum sp. NKW23]